MRLLTSVLQAPVWNTAGHIDGTSLKTDPTEGTWLCKRKGDSARWAGTGWGGEVRRRDEIRILSRYEGQLRNVN